MVAMRRVRLDDQEDKGHRRRERQEQLRVRQEEDEGAGEEGEGGQFSSDSVSRTCSPELETAGCFKRQGRTRVEEERRRRPGTGLSVVTRRYTASSGSFAFAFCRSYDRLLVSETIACALGNLYIDPNVARLEARLYVEETETSETAERAGRTPRKEKERRWSCIRRRSKARVARLPTGTLIGDVLRIRFSKTRRGGKPQDNRTLNTR